MNCSRCNVLFISIIQAGSSSHATPKMPHFGEPCNVVLPKEMSTGESDDWVKPPARTGSSPVRKPVHKRIRIWAVLEAQVQDNASKERAPSTPHCSPCVKRALPLVSSSCSLLQICISSHRKPNSCSPCILPLPKHRYSLNKRQHGS